jgi:hypothetical protein
MDPLFSLCNRLCDLLESRGREGHRKWLQELNLDVSTEELFSAQRTFTYADLHDMVANDNAVVWLTPNAAVVGGHNRAINPWMLLDGARCICFKADGKVLFGWARSAEHLSEICDVVLRVLAASVVHSLLFNKWDSRHALPSGW